MKQIELDKIISRHQHWLKHDCNGWETMKANLSGADLRKADLSGVNLLEADLRDADLRGADMSGANLFGADLYWANLSGADLTKANLSNADLYGADLRGANLRGANLSGADLAHAEIYTATFDKKENIRKGITITEPMKGYKKTSEGVVITVEIPAGAVVYSINGTKCRTNIATITNMEGHNLLHSQYKVSFTYTMGQKIIIPDFDTRYNVECSTGFHFFRTKEEAMAY